MNYPINKKTSTLINFNYIFNLLSYFFKLYNIEIYFFKAYINYILSMYVYIYINAYPKKNMTILKKYNYFIKC